MRYFYVAIAELTIMMGYRFKRVASSLLFVGCHIFHTKYWRRRQHIGAACAILFLILAMSAGIDGRWGWYVLWTVFYFISYFFVTAHSLRVQEYLLKIWDKLLKWNPFGFDPKA